MGLEPETIRTTQTWRHRSNQLSHEGAQISQPSDVLAGLNLSR